LQDHVLDFFGFVNQHVCFSIWFYGKSPTTYFTPIWSFTSMDTMVHFQTKTPRKTLMTYFTRVWTFPCVLCHVST
jgi:hypothetical protein